MELLEGEDLNIKIKKSGPLPLNTIHKIFQQTLSGMAYAHSKGIIHRDIKPSNLFILNDGGVKILDFGIAKILSNSGELTQTGMQIGSPIYMSPEQVKGDKNIDLRSDIYSLGITLFYSITGNPPYDSTTESQFDILSKIVHEPLPKVEGNNIYTEMIAKACEKDKLNRYQNCEEWLKLINNKKESNENLLNHADGSDSPPQNDITVLVSNTNSIKSNAEIPKKDGNIITRALLIFWKAIKNDYFKFKGRCGKLKYWTYTITSLIIFIITVWLPIGIVFLIFIIIPTLSIGYRRMHDVGKPGYFIFIPIYSLVLSLREGDKNQNKYGEPND
jgi:serine/threonine protein kinase